ncbi:hypothetical protein TNCV_637651 [Trichonephila clavipes]|nr:hypothetical protein TNCV_637651 [Trichonephila clavipes]
MGSNEFRLKDRLIWAHQREDVRGENWTAPDVLKGSGEENPRVLFGDADQESEARMSKNALWTGRRQAVE